MNGAFCEILLSAPCVVEVEPELTHGHEDVFVEHVADEVAHSLVVVPTVLQQERKGGGEGRGGGDEKGEKRKGGGG